MLKKQKMQNMSPLIEPGLRKARPYSLCRLDIFREPFPDLLLSQISQQFLPLLSCFVCQKGLGILFVKSYRSVFLFFILIVNTRKFLFSTTLLSIFPVVIVETDLNNSFYFALQ